MSADRTPGDFGTRLRAAREQGGLTLRQIASSTKISVGVLEALERNDLSRLPGGIFGRAFVRSYAIEVGLDPEATIQDFVAQFPNDSVTVGHLSSDRIEDNTALESERRTAGTFLSLLAISIPVAAGVLYFGTAGRRAVHQAPVPVTVEAATPAAEPAPPVDQPAPVSAASTPATAPPAVPVALPAAPAAVPHPPDGDRLTIALSVKRP